MVCPGNANIGEKAMRASLAPPKCEEQKSKASCTGRAGKCDLRTRSEGLTASKAPGSRAEGDAAGCRCHGTWRVGRESGEPAENAGACLPVSAGAKWPRTTEHVGDLSDTANPGRVRW